MSNSSDDDSSSARPHKRVREDQNEGDEQQEAAEVRIEFHYIGQPIAEIPRNITHLTVASTVGEIEHSAFEACEDLVSAIIPKTVEVIGEKAFYGCTALVDVQLHFGLKRINPMAFACCTALAEIVVPEGLNTIGDIVFGRCESLKTFTIPTNFLFVGVSWFWSCQFLVEVHFHDAIRAIRREAFYKCKSLRAAEFPEALVVIGEGAFEECTALSTVALPPNLEEIEVRAFASCEGLITVEVPPNANIRIHSESFHGCTALMNVSVPTHTLLAGDAFSECYLLNGEIEDEEIANALLRDRFRTLPVHRVLYNSLDLTEENLIQVLHAFNSRAVSRDAFGLTPLHTMAASVKLQENILECLLNWYPVEHLLQSDKHGLRVLDYLLWNSSKMAVTLIKTMLRKTIITTISSWIGGAKWESHLISQLELIGSDDNTRQKIEQVHDFMGHAGYYVRLEMTSLLELALWKCKMTMMKSSEDDENFRADCRFQCGADVVIENVAEFLWFGKSRACTALRLYPLSTMILGSEIMFDLDEEEDAASLE